jgi:hypothetical protein
MTTVYYNFPNMEIPMQGTDYTKEIQLPIVGQPIVNIQLNDINYIAYSIIIAKNPNTNSPSTEPGYLVVKCYADINDTTSNLIYFAVPLIVPQPTSGQSADAAPTNKSDVDNMISANGATTKLTLNDYIKNGSGCVVKQTPFPLTIKLGEDSAIHVQSLPEVFRKFYEHSKIPNIDLIIDVNQTKNAKLQQQDLDWVMSCELLTEDGPPKMEAVDPGTTATTISLFMMAIIIACTVYLAGPIIYKSSGLYDLAERVLDGNHYTINIYWGVTLLFTAFLALIQGLTSNHPTYFFIVIALALSYYSGTSAILKMPEIGNDTGTGFESDNMNAFQIYSEIISGECSSFSQQMIKLGMTGVVVLLFIGMTISMGLGVDSAFVANLAMFIGASFILLIITNKFSSKQI